ncbi:5-hydroxytryptamine receptor 2A isoform X2 [Schistocerca gregaria]|uniref:5-hydroxytryptamine receptor 2A isoform X2 n=1 Tax=Schistocerca gregaria TaxID=7010 RepID=UPI00211F245F|nr:5-hydroxytryptamine receptor 2A isoform X2 [Schistocerca gregaria]
MLNASAEAADPGGGGGGGGGANWWALLALLLVVATAAGNVLVCLAIAWERRLQNVTNYFLMSLAITDLMVAVLVMPLGILTLVTGYFPLAPVYCLAWICLDVLFCTASIMHLTTISVDRYLSLRYPMKFGRNKTRRRVTLKIVFVWLLSIAMSLPLSLMYSQDHTSVLVAGTCQIPDPLYKLIGSIVCFYIPLVVMLLTYALTVRLLAVQQQNLCGGGAGGSAGGGWSSGWMGGAPSPVRWLWRAGGGGLERRGTWRRLLGTRGAAHCHGQQQPQHQLQPPQQQQPRAHHGQQHSAASTDTELSALDLWLPDDAAPSAASALSQLGAEMLRLSRRLECVGAAPTHAHTAPHTPPATTTSASEERSVSTSPCGSQTQLCPPAPAPPSAAATPRRRASTVGETPARPRHAGVPRRRRGSSFHQLLPPSQPPQTQTAVSDVVIVATSACGPPPGHEPSVVTWRRGSASTCRTSLLAPPPQPQPAGPLRRAATLRLGHAATSTSSSSSVPPSPAARRTVRAHHSRTSSVASRTSSRHGRILRLEQKATKVLGVVFFTFVVLWAPFFVLNLVPALCAGCERHIQPAVFDLVTWLGYASSMVNPVFYTIFNKVFRQAFRKVLLCQYKSKTWRPSP